VKRLLLYAALFLAACAASAFGLTPFKVLVLYGGGDAGHSPMSLAGRPVLEKLGAAAGFTVEFTADKTVLNDAALATVPLLVMLNQYPFELSGSQRAAFQKYIESGKGWVGIHSTGCAQPDWAWYAKFLGNVTWVGHANLRQGTLLFEDRDHPVTKAMPASFALNEEWYQFSRSPRPDVRVLAKAGPTGNASYDNGGDHPMVWCNPAFPKAIYISPGHDAGDWAVPAYAALVRDAILWAGPQNATPILGIARPMPSQRETLWIGIGSGPAGAEGLGSYRDAVGRIRVR
jgi:type 1 glutamine amidotransferase